MADSTYLCPSKVTTFYKHLTSKVTCLIFPIFPKPYIKWDKPHDLTKTLQKCHKGNSIGQ